MTKEKIIPSHTLPYRGLDHEADFSQHGTDPYAGRVMEFGCPQSVMDEGDPQTPQTITKLAGETKHVLTRNQRRFLKEKSRTGPRQGGGQAKILQTKG